MKFLGNVKTDNLILLDVKYARPRNGSPDYAMLLFKNVKSGKKFVYNIENPQIEIFFVKNEFRKFQHNQTAINKNFLYSKTVNYKDVLSTIASEAGGEWREYYYRCIQQSNYKAIRNIFHYPYCFGADIDICDYYRCLWDIHYLNHDIKYGLTKAYLDIESDVVDFAGIPEPGLAPINMVSVCDSKNYKVHTFCLRNAARPNPLIKEFESNIDNFYKKCHETYDEEFPDFKYQVYMFDDELKLLKVLFKVLRDIDPDFLGIWNMAYDVQNIIARCTRLGGDPKELFCDSDYKSQLLNYWADRNTGKPVLKKDFFDVTSKIIWTDLMLNYGKLRKNSAQLRSIKLDYIAKKEIQSGKFEYSGSYDKMLPYTDYEKFVLYSIKDVLLLHAIENKVEDINDVFTRATVNGSSYKTIFSQTRFLKNRFYIECYKDGFIAGNNPNVDYAKPYIPDDDDEVKFDGAVVGDPELNDYVGEKIFGSPSKYVFKYVIDMDFSSMYPWTIISFNISAQTMIGKLLIDNEYYHGSARNVYEEDENLKFECGKEYVENYLSKDIIRLGMNWHNLPSVEEMLNDLNSLYIPPKKNKIEVVDDIFAPEVILDG